MYSSYFCHHKYFETPTMIVQIIIGGEDCQNCKPHYQGQGTDEKGDYVLCNYKENEDEL